MFVGHYAVAFAAKRAAPRLSLGVLVAAAQLIDLVWPMLLMAGFEHVRIAPGTTRVTPLDFYHYPYTHSLAAVAGWGAIAGGIVAAMRRTGREAAVVSALVVSHWFLDLVVHRPDLPITFGGSARWGLGLWNSPLATLVVEGGLLLAGVAVYARTTFSRDRIGRFGWWTLVAFLAVMYVANFFGPPPPNVEVLAFSGLALWLTPLWAWWADRRRSLSRPASVSGLKSNVVRFTKDAARR